MRCIYIFFIFLFSVSYGQDRYPYVQKPTETSVLIAWRTQASGIGTLKYGTDPGNLNITITEPASVTKHAITITGLQPNTKYYYQTTTNGVNSNVEHFYTAKPKPVKNMSFLLYADCGYGLSSTQQTGIANLMKQEDVDLALVAGDVDQGTGNNYQGNFFAVYKDMLARDCHFPALGNHDIIANGGNTYRDDFYLFTNNPANTENYYSFEWGNAKFIALDSNSPYTSGTAQYNWLVNELKCHDSEWVFVYFHHPPWTNAWDLTYYVPFQPFYQYRGNVDMRTSIVPLFEQYDVDYVLNGHSHCYQRGSLNGVHYLISGGAGASTLDFNTNSSSPNIQVERYVNQYMRFDIKGDTVTFRSIDINGNVVDNLTVTKSYTAYHANFSKSDISCSGGGNDGTVTVSAVGPRPPYTYAWSTGSSAATVTGLSAGIYTVTVTDKNGCQKVENVEIIEPVCEVTISGNILTEQGNPIADVVVTLSGTSDLKDTTGADGLYSFKVPVGSSVKVAPAKSNDSLTLACVSTVDLVMMQRHVLFIQQLSSPYKIMAADVNGTGSVSTIDIGNSRSVILASTSGFPSGKFWTFASSDFSITDSLNPFPYDTARLYNNINTNMTNQHFTGMKFGDVNNTWDLIPHRLSTVGEVDFLMEEYQTAPGDEIVIPVRVRDFVNVSGYQFTISWNPDVLEFLETTNVSVAGFYGINNTANGFLTTSWNDATGAAKSLNDNAVAFELKFKVIGNTGAFSEIKIGSELTQSEAYNNGLELLFINPNNGKVNVNDALSIQNLKFKILNLRVQPNPFHQTTSIIFSLPHSGKVNIEIYDLLGKTIRTFEGDFHAGENKIEWDGNDSKGIQLSAGLYHVRMRVRNETAGIKVAVVR